MNRKELAEFHKEFCDTMHATMQAKNADYTGDASDPFANFTTVEELGIATTEQGFLTRMTDKMKRIISFVNKGELQVKDESVQDTLMDLANYCIIFAAYIRSKQNVIEQSSSRSPDLQRNAGNLRGSYDRIPEKPRDPWEARPYPVSHFLG
jgi:hypothetical protein